MRKIISVAVLSLFVFGANAASNSRPAMSGKIIMSAPRYTASVNQLNGLTGITNVKNHDEVVEPVSEPEIDTREAERNACINNNVGVGNTFVWASRYSDTSNYASMVEDTKNPQNNVCFVRVELKSDDSSRVSVSDIPAQYFMWGQTIECGSWANANEIEQRILDAKKGARIGGIVAASVGGAGVGVGAMELFGNKAIGGKLQGQKEDEITMYKSYLKYLETNNYNKYKEVMEAMKVVRGQNGFADFDRYEEEFIREN